MCLYTHGHRSSVEHWMRTRRLSLSGDACEKPQVVRGRSSCTTLALLRCRLPLAAAPSHRRRPCTLCHLWRVQPVPHRPLHRVASDARTPGCDRRRLRVHACPGCKLHRDLRCAACAVHATRRTVAACCVVEHNVAYSCGYFFQSLLMEGGPLHKGALA